MLKRILVIVFVFYGITVFSQETSKIYKIKFTDKSNSVYNINDPGAFLSPRAIERRQRTGIEIGEDDLPVSTGYLQEIIDMGGEILVQSKWLNLVIASFENGVTINQIRTLAFVAQVDDAENMRRKQMVDMEEKSFFKNESYSMDLTHNQQKSSSDFMAFDYGASFNQIDMLNGIGLHNDGFTGEGIIIAVLDAGFWRVNQMEAFDTLWANNRILDSYNFVEPEESVYDSTIHKHGMMVLSLMGGNLPGQLVGTAPDASYYLLRTEDATAEYLMEEYFWVMAAEWADCHGADIINSSLGYTEFDDPQENHTYADLDGNTTPITIGADKAAEKGILVCSSAGNYADDPWLYVGAPSDGDSVFTVGAVKPDGSWATFSSIGPTYDGRLKPDAVAQGQQAVIASPSGGIQTGNGTSFSSPIMAGMVACLWQANRDFNNMEVIKAITYSCDQKDDPDYQMGNGIPDFVEANNIIGTIEIQNPENLSNLIIIPNPYHENFQVHFVLENDGIVSLIIHDLAGRIVYSNDIAGMAGANLIDMNKLSEIHIGIYILRIQTNKEVVTCKLIKS